MKTKHSLQEPHDAEALIESGLNTLREHQFKITQRRREMLELFANNPQYMSAQEVHEIMSRDNPTMSYNTTYRNLYDFVDCNILEMTEYQQEQRFKINCQTGHHHHHFICTKCGKAIPISYCPMDKVSEELAGVEVQSHRFEIFGVCEKCQ